MRLIISFNNKNWPLPTPFIQPIPNNEIWYTSLDGNIVIPYRESSLPPIVSNTYVNGKGIIKCDSDITYIRDYAFGDCTGLTSVLINNSVTNLGEGAFTGCTGLKNILIGNSIIKIWEGAFRDCSSLITITIPNSVTSIGNLAFYGCTSLSSISYTGTIEQYNAISKGTNWNTNVPATVVHCTDGDTLI